MADEKTPKAKTSPPVKPAKVFDVAKPAETPAAATSRPVIVGHTNSMQTDPMVAPVAESTPIEAKTEK